MLDSPLVTKLLSIAIEEDLSQGDITSELTVPENLKGAASYIAKEELVVCGTPLVPKLIAVLNFNLEYQGKIPDGKRAKSGDVIGELSGPVRQILAIERVSLNFLQRLSGIATLTNKMAELSGKTKILDTRKTTPGLRLLEKYAVKTGGGENHRMNLGDMILVKNNHIDAQESFQNLLKKVFEKRPDGIRVEVEVRDMEELKTALSFKPELVMLDNMDDAEVSKCLEFARQESPQTKIEVSGGVTAERLPELSRLGVDYVSMGMITNKAGSMDISLRLKRE